MAPPHQLNHQMGVSQEGLWVRCSQLLRLSLNGQQILLEGALLLMYHILPLPWELKSLFPLGLVAPSLFFRLLDVCLEPGLTLAQPSVSRFAPFSQACGGEFWSFSIMISSLPLRPCVLVTSSHHSCRLCRGLTLMACLGLSLGPAVLVIKLHCAARQNFGRQDKPQMNSASLMLGQTKPDHKASTA